MNNKTFIIVVSILAVVSIIGFMSYFPTRFDISSKIKVTDFPKTIGEWTGTDMPIDELTYKILETRNLFIRDYKDTKGNSIYLYIVYSEDNRKVSHPPEVCLMGGGITIVDKAAVQITNLIRATKLTVEKANSRELVIYWYKAGYLNTDKYLKQQLKIVTDRMFGKRTPGALIRLSTEIKQEGEVSALELVKEFCEEMVPLLAKYVP